MKRQLAGERHLGISQAVREADREWTSVSADAASVTVR